MSDEYVPTADNVCDRFVSMFVDPDVKRREREAFDRWLAAHDAEVTRQQAERDAREVTLIRNGYNRNGNTHRVLTNVIVAIRAANPPTTPKETR